MGQKYSFSDLVIRFPVCFSFFLSYLCCKMTLKVNFRVYTIKLCQIQYIV